MIVSAALIACITLATGLPTPSEMPREEVLTIAEMQERYPEYAHYWGLYIYEAWPGFVVLRWSRQHQARVHEYTHHWQVMAGVNPETPEAEAVAVMTQGRCGGL